MGAAGGQRESFEQRDEESGRKLRILSGRQHRALVQGARVLIDEIFEDYANMYRGRDPGQTLIVAECLPRQFRGRYTESFIKQFIVCVVAVSGRLVDWHGEEIANSIGESLALYVIVEKAILFLMAEDKERGEEIEEDEDLDFRNFERVAFVDGEYTFLFDSSLYDLADDEIAAYDGMPLKLQQWFIPSYEEPAHPYLRGDDGLEEDLGVAL